MCQLFQMILRNKRMDNVEYKDLHGTSRMDVEKFQDKTKPNINMDDKNGLKDVYRMKG